MHRARFPRLATASTSFGLSLRGHRALVEYKRMSLEAAAREVIHVRSRIARHWRWIALDTAGDIVMDFNSPGACSARHAIRVVVATLPSSGTRRPHALIGPYHGGAGAIPETLFAQGSGARQRRESLSKVLDTTFALLERGGTSLDAVTNAVRNARGRPTLQCRARRARLRAKAGRNSMLR